MDLFNFINKVQVEIEKTQQQFFFEWNSRIKTQLSVPDNFKIESCVDVFGGYTLNHAQYKAMSKELQSFYDRRISQKDGIYHLRGYDYYYTDPLVHLKKNRKNSKQFWKILQRKWKKYSSGYDFSFLKKESMSLENWIGTLGVCEYIFSDIASLSWFVYRNKTNLVFMSKDSESMLLSSLNNSAQIVGNCIAALLVFDFHQSHQLLNNAIEHIVSIDLAEYLDLPNCVVEDWSVVRSIREGDSLVLIYAAYLMKLLPHIRKHNHKHIVFVSNSFGAMYTGHIMKYLLFYECGIECKSYNVLFAQNRAEEDVIYNGDCSYCCSFLENTNIDLSDAQEIFVVDDSIFTGNSYLKIKDFLLEKTKNDSCMIHLLPLTVNCDCIKFCRRGIRPEDDINQIAIHVVNWSKQVGKTLPPFLSFWDFSRVAPENDIYTVYEEVREVLQGDDRLMKHLWARFELEIALEELIDED